MGCSLATSLVARIKEIKRTVNPDYLFIEPSEMVLTQEMLDATRMGLRDVSYEIGPFITLIDGPDFPRSGKNGGPCSWGRSIRPTWWRSAGLTWLSGDEY